MEMEIAKMKISEILELKKNKMLSSNVEYQRGPVWKQSQQKKLIDSILRNYPLPLLYLHHIKKSVAGMVREDMEIIDGQQRIDAIEKFAEGAFKLYDTKDDEAKFPNFVRQMPCLWANKDIDKLRNENLEIFDKFFNTELLVAKITTSEPNEARDLFIRLQSGLPLNAQEKRDAWPGGYTEFVLKFGGKSLIAKYPGHDFFKNLISIPSINRGEVRILCAQIGMLFFEKTKGTFLDLSTKSLDDYFYKNLDFDMNSPNVIRFSKVLDKAYSLLSKEKIKKIKGHEAIHLILMIDDLIEDYSPTWETKFYDAFINFRENFLKETRLARKEQKYGEFWDNYGRFTQQGSDKAVHIRIRHNFFIKKMYEFIQPQKLDTTRIFGTLEREIIYYRHKKKCAKCDVEIPWNDLEIHHLQEHYIGGPTILENGVPVHKLCHPKGKENEEFSKKWFDKIKNNDYSIQ